MKVVDQLRKDAHSIWKEIIEHPFVMELATGELPLKKFKFYILQDYSYLITAMRNFAIIASRAPSVETMREVIDILNLEAKTEFNGYKDFLKRLGYTLQDASQINPISVNVSYSNFLLSTSSLKSYAEAITSVLPCFWSYAEIADHYKKRLNTNPNQLYKDWLEVYGTYSYLSLVNKMKNLVNSAGEGFSYEKLKHVFITASRYEYMFWDAVYKQQEWPV